MDHILHISRRDNDTLFLSVSESVEYFKSIYGYNVDLTDIQALIEKNILPVFKSGDDQFIFLDDLSDIAPIIFNNSNFKSATSGFELFSESFFKRDTILLSSNTQIALIREDADANPVFCAAVRNLASKATSLSLGDAEHEISSEISLPYFSSARIFTSVQEIADFANNQLARAAMIDRARASQFARSAHYMGSKKALASFLVEAISSILPEDGVVVDLMCGSGAASGAFNKIWRTIASDAQEFSRLLSFIHGGGFSINGAQQLISDLLPIVHQHVNDLRSFLHDSIEREDRIFHGDLNLSLLEEYRSFIRSFHTYPDSASNGAWRPLEEVEKRQVDSKLRPFCLFTAYFSNIYFGLRQCVEIDSLRFAIDQIRDEKNRRWALGALIATLSALGTTYGGHFAQPAIKEPESITLSNLPRILERRAYSVIHEFTVRLMNLAEESEKTNRPIEIVAGPWQEALNTLEDTMVAKRILVYLDAPYKREEYSRYYHILETAVSYSYPSCIGKGKIPNKSRGERFQSEFFTKSEEKIEESFVQIISEILKRNCICAWSYSDSGAANIVNVLNSVNKIVPSRVRSYSVPFVHKSHGGRFPKKVTEYLILLMPVT